VSTITRTRAGYRPITGAVLPNAAMITAAITCRMTPAQACWAAGGKSIVEQAFVLGVKMFVVKASAATRSRRRGDAGAVLVLAPLREGIEACGNTV